MATQYCAFDRDARNHPESRLSSRLSQANETAVHHWIAEPATLAGHLARWTNLEVLALDTEFIRERTWWPQLALVQMAIPGHDILLVDPTVPGMADVLRPLLDNPAIVKLMHSASEDVQALQRGCGALPAPLFDTQIAAALCGLGAALGYQKLVETQLGVVLAKSETRSDWLRRPLSDAQLSYAADDVLSLHALHTILREKLRELGREPWLAEDCARLVASSGNESPERYPHLSVRSAQYLDPDAQALLCRLLRWRELQARATDRPKGWIIDNEAAVALARKPPVDARALNSFLDTQPKAPRKLRTELWNALAPPLTAEERDVPLLRTPDSAHKKLLRDLQDAVATESALLGLADGILASRRTLEALLDGDGWPAALDGWRRPILEPVLLPLLKGAG
jgi:ribonuclease D